MKQKWIKIVQYIEEHEMLVIVFFFLVNFLLRGLLSDYSKAIRIYNDELYYYGIAKSIFYGEGITVRGMPVELQKILYSLFLVPTFAIQSSVLRMKAIAWINSALISLSVFPAYGIAKKIFSQKKYIYVALLYWFTMSTMISPVYIMCESLFLPLALTFVYMALVAFESYRKLCTGESDKKMLCGQMLLHAGMGVLLYLMFQIKTSSLYFLVAYVLVCAIACMKNLFDKGRSRREGIRQLLTFLVMCVILLAVFAGLYYLVKTLLYQGNDNIYFVNAANTKKSIVGQRMLVLLQYYPYNLVYMILAFGVIQVLMPLGIWKRLCKKERQIQLFLLLCMFVACGAITYIVSSKEAAGMHSVREHIRYVEPLIYVSWCAFIGIVIKHKEDYDAKAWKITTLIHTLYFAVFVMIASNFNGKTIIDHSYLKVYQWVTELLAAWTEAFGQGTLVPLLFRVLLSAGFAGILYLFYQKNKKILTWFIIGSIGLNICNYVIAYKMAYDTYHADESLAARFDETDDYLMQLEGNILVVANIKDVPVQPYLDTYIARPVYIVTLRDLYDSKIIEDRKIDLSEEKIPAKRPEPGYYVNLKNVDYILTWGNISVEQVEKMDKLPIEEDGYILYKNLAKEEVYVSCTFQEVMTEEEREKMQAFSISFPLIETIQE